MGLERVREKQCGEDPCLTVACLDWCGGVQAPATDDGDMHGDGRAAASPGTARHTTDLWFELRSGMQS